MANTNISELSVTIMKELKAYSDDIAEEIKKEAKRVAKECVDELKETSPKDTGKYRKSWKTKVEYENRQSIRIKIYNTESQLTHLLEKGHAKVGGGRVRAIPHIEPAEQNAVDKFQRAVEGVINRQ